MARLGGEWTGTAPSAGCATSVVRHTPSIDGERGRAAAATTLTPAIDATVRTRMGSRLHMACLLARHIARTCSVSRTREPTRSTVGGVRVPLKRNDAPRGPWRVLAHLCAHRA